MQIAAVDSENNLFRIENVFPQHLAKQILETPWTELDWARQGTQEHWPRRLIKESAIPWINEWHHYLRQAWDSIGNQIGVELQPYQGTAFWVDEPGFTCAMHTDGELPGGLHLIWIGPGTKFYWHNNPNTVRYQVPEQPNCGYIMVNQSDINGYRRLLWHDMLTPVKNFRVTSYTWITPQ